MNAITVTVTAVFPASTAVVSNYIQVGRVVINCMTNNPRFPTPVPPLSEVSANFDALEASQQLVIKGDKGAALERNVCLRKTRRCVNMLTVYVENIANEDQEHASAIILSAGMAVGKSHAWTKPLLDVKYGSASGCVIIVAKALANPVCYHWQMSTDQITWTDLPATFHAKTSVEGLTPATIYAFRLRTMTKAGLSAWSPPVTIIAH